MKHVAFLLPLLTILVMAPLSASASELSKRRKLNNQLSAFATQSDAAIKQLVNASPVVQLLQNDASGEQDDDAIIESFVSPEQKKLLARYALAQQQGKDSQQWLNLKKLPLKERVTLLTALDKLDLPDEIDLKGMLARELISHSRAGNVRNLLAETPIYTDLAQTIAKRMMAVSPIPLQTLLNARKRDLFESNYILNEHDDLQCYGVSADNARVRYVVSSQELIDGVNTVSYKLEERDTHNFTLLSSTYLNQLDEEVKSLEMSSDGRWLMYDFDRDMYGAYLYDTLNNTEVRISLENEDLDSLSVDSMVMSADNTQVVIMSHDELESEVEDDNEQTSQASLFAFDVQSQTLTPLAHRISYGLRSTKPIISPDGRYCAISCDVAPAQKEQFANNTKIVHVIRIPTQEMITLYHSAPQELQVKSFKPDSIVFLDNSTLSVAGINCEKQINLAPLAAGLHDCARIGTVKQIFGYSMSYATRQGDYILRMGEDEGAGIAVQHPDDQPALLHHIGKTEERDSRVEWNKLIGYFYASKSFKKISLKKLSEADEEIRSLKLDQLCLLQAAYAKALQKSTQKIGITPEIYQALPPILTQTLSHILEPLSAHDSASDSKR